MAGMEGGVGGNRLNWRQFWLGMLIAAMVMIVGVSIGIHFGWLH